MCNASFGLIFEDDPVGLKLLLRILSRDYRVIGFSSVEAGFDLLWQAGFLISDLEMAGMGGRGLVALVREQRLCKPLLIVSGTDEHEVGLMDLQEYGIKFLQKPFSSKVLLDAVSRLFGPSKVGGA